MASGISIVICCFNGEDRLEATLKHIAAQEGMSADLWEVIIVNNASTDNTADFGRKIWASIPGNKPAFQVVEEVNPGLTNARLKGIETSRFPYVLFCDDDNWLEKNYAFSAMKIMKSHPEIGVLGGQGSPVFEQDEPPYFWQNQYHALAVGPQADMEGDITDTRPVVYGAGMVLKKIAFRALLANKDFRFLSTDRIQHSLESSGDHELCLAVAQMGYRIYWSSKLVFRHFIPSSRTTISYYRKLFYAFGSAYALLQPYRLTPYSRGSFRHDYRYICLQNARNIAIGNLRLLFSGYYFTSDRYKHIGTLQKIYTSRGIFDTSLKIKNTLNYFFNIKQ